MMGTALRRCACSKARMRRVASSPSMRGHLQIHQHHIKPAIAERLDGLLPIACNGGLVPPRSRWICSSSMLAGTSSTTQDAQQRQLQGYEPTGRAAAGCSGGDRQHRERGAHAHGAAHADAAAHQLGQLARDGGAQAGAARNAAWWTHRPVQRVEDALRCCAAMPMPVSSTSITSVPSW